MSIRNLEHLLAPASVAVIGASNRIPSVGGAVMRNLLAGGLDGPVMPVNPKYLAVAGVLAYPDVAALPVVPELAVICTPAPTVPEIVSALGERGCRAAVVLSAGLSAAGPGGMSVEQAMLEAARPHLLRILGPNCLGLLVPGIGLNASFAHIGARPGHLALVHQSGALCTALLDWAASKDIGFSHFLSIGDSADVDFGDLLDYLGADPEVQAILLYMESVAGRFGNQVRKFMSAARAAARNKPVLVIKAGRASEGARAAQSHTGALAGADNVYDAAFRRAGMLRVYDTDEMFDAVETLSHGGPPPGERLAILTNGGGPGVMATDSLILAGGTLAELSAATIAALDAHLPSVWSRANPVDVIGDAGGERYARALSILLDAPEVDTVLVLHAPTAVVSSRDVARRVIDTARERDAASRIFTCWLGGETVAAARRALRDANIPGYDTPGSAVRGFMHRIQHRRNQALLMETPPAARTQSPPDRDAVERVLDAAAAQGREMLTEPEAKEVLAAYRIPVVSTHTVASVDEAVSCAGQLGFPVALKILSDDISHKSDVGGVRLDLESAEAVAREGEAMIERVRRLAPHARVAGFTVQPMARRPRALELIVGVTRDPVFGPVILFGEGGTAVELIADTAIALPPLNVKLADELIRETRISRRMGAHRDHPAVDRDALIQVLLAVSRMVVDLPRLVELDINPLLVDADGVIALDARLRIDPPGAPAEDRLAIRAYPDHLEERVEVDGMTLLLRPIRPEDEPAHAEFFTTLSPSDVRFRFFGQVRELPHSQLARFTQIDYEREMAFVAIEEDAHGSHTLGVVRAVCLPDEERAEFAIVISSRLKGRGLGRTLLEKMIRYCRDRGIGELVGEVLADNEPMLRLARSLGFELRRDIGEEAVRVNLDLRRAAPA